MNRRINDHLIAALRELAHAQTLADAEVSRSFCRDIPAGKPTIYACAHAFAHDIQRIRSDIRGLTDLPNHNVTIRPIPRAVPTEHQQRPAVVDSITGQSPVVVHGGSSDEDRTHAPA